MPSTLPPLTPQQRRAQRASQVVYWRKQEESVRKERRFLKFAPLMGLLFAALTRLLVQRPVEALCVFLLGCLIGLMGWYMTAVRLDEFGDRRREAEAELLRVQHEGEMSD